jgi:protein TonB
MRPAAIAAAVVLIGIGVAFVVTQNSGGPGESTPPDAALTAPQESRSPAVRQPVIEQTAEGTAAAIPNDRTTAPASIPTAAAAKAAPSRPGVAHPESAQESRRGESPIEDVATVRPTPVTAPPATPSAALPSPSSSPTVTAPSVATAPEVTTARTVPLPQPEAEFIPDIAPDGTLPSATVAGDATLARYVGPELIASTRATPVFPPGARQMRMSGQVKLQVKVRTDGSVGAVSVISEPKPAVGFGKAAETAVRQWRYRPATLGSRAVESEIVVVVNFAGD